MPRSALGAVLALVLVGAAALAAPGFDEQGYDLAARTILCDCGCHPQSVHACACSRAAEMRDDVAALIRSGMSGEQVIAKYVAEHGEKIRIVPVARGFNLLAWLGPLVGLLLASVGVALVVYRWSRSRGPAGAPSADPAAPAFVAPAPVAGDDAYRARLRRELEDWS